MTRPGDIRTNPHPERAERGEPLTITVDWLVFDQERIGVTLGTLSDDAAS